MLHYNQSSAVASFDFYLFHTLKTTKTSSRKNLVLNNQINGKERTKMTMM